MQQTFAGLSFATFISALTYSASTFATNSESVQGVSGYIPLNQNPVFEEHVNRLMIASEMGAVKRPYAINAVKKAYNKTCSNSTPSQAAVQRSCIELKKYFNKVATNAYVNHASVSLSTQKTDDLYTGQPAQTIANERGRPLDTSWSVQGQAVYQLGQYMAFSGGVQAWQNEQYLEDTYVSVGIAEAQLDIGYKPHWLSPFKHSAMLLSTNAPTFANISLSNSVPLTDWNINYELFVGELSQTNKIYYQGELTSGNPLLTGIHLSFSPFDGVTFAANRILQSGGDQRGTPSLKELLDAFLDPSGADNTGSNLTTDEQFGNQAASIVTRYDFVGRVPFSVYLEYAGEDTSRGSNYRLGNTSLSAGIDFPVIFDDLSLNYEYSQWQNAWYSHSVYRDGLQNEGSIIGHFAAEQRNRTNTVAGSGVGATHHNLTLAKQINPKTRLEFNFNQTVNADYTEQNYITGRDFALTLHKEIKQYRIKLKLFGGENTLAEEHYGIALQLGWR